MTDKIILFDGSRKLHSRIPLEAIAEIAKARGQGIEVDYRECPGFLQPFIERAFEPERSQVNAYSLTNDLHQQPELRRNYEAGKLIIVDEDAYSGDPACNWFFGALSKCPESLGYLFVSTNRMQSENHTRDTFRHELGHMFGAPSEGRSNTYESDGLHCSNDLCVMQQKDTVHDAVAFAEQRAMANAPTFCSQCKEDIQRFEVK